MGPGKISIGGDQGAASVGGVRDDHPAHHQIEQEHRVDRQRLPRRRIAVAQELHGGEGAPREARQHDHTPATRGYHQSWVTVKVKMPHLTMTRAVFWFARSTTRHRTKDRTRGRRQ